VNQRKNAVVALGEVAIRCEALRVVVGRHFHLSSS
jgi:hypothetical protein